MKPKKKKKEFNDLLIPVIAILLILPFVTRLLVYESGFDRYTWFPEQDLLSDFFSYYKSYGLVLTAVVSGIILAVYFVLYRTRIKNMKLFIPLGIYSLIIVASTLFSVDVHTSVVGGMAHFESTFVLIGYVIIAAYTYQMVQSEEDFKNLLKVLVFSVMILGFLGVLQMSGKDVFGFNWFQKLIIPRDYWADYVGNIKNHLSTNAVSLTLFNPNYASVYVSMLIPIFMVRLLSEEKKKIKVIYGVLLGILFLIQFKTYSRTGFLSLLVSFAFMAYFYRSRLKHMIAGCLSGFALLAVLFLLVDAFSSFRFITKLGDTIKSFNRVENEKPLEAIYTDTDFVVINYKGEKLQITFAESIAANSPQFKNAAGEELGGNYNPDTGKLAVTPFQDMKFTGDIREGQELLTVRIDNYDWIFGYNKEQGYYYINDFGKTEKLVSVPAFGFENYGHIASGRGYIWSRSIPLLLKNPLIGTGPDTFPIVFPQGDHVGKANYCKTPYTIIERPHNMYLMIGIQTGILSLILFLVFYFIYFLQSLRIYSRIKSGGYTWQLGLGCLLATISYMISGLFNDSTLQTSPAFWVFLGLGMAANYRLKPHAFSCK